MNKSNRRLRNLTLFLLYLCAFSLGIKSFSEPDLWWQIRTGEWILANHAIPRVDLFSYTLPGVEWINIKWGFEVLAALVSSRLGPESVYLLQAILAVLLFHFLFRLSKLFIGNESKSNDPSLVFSLVLSFLITALATEYRINGRPEMFSHLFTVIFLFLLTRNRIRPSNAVFLLPLLQIAWVNMHEAYAMGIVLITLFCGGSWIEWWLKRKVTPSVPSTIPRLTAVWTASVAALTMNPYGLKLVTRPLDIFNQVQENKYTTELLSVTTSGYWKTQTWVALIILVVAAWGVAAYFLQTKDRKRRLAFFAEKTGIGYCLAVLSFLYLALTAYRNIIFLVLVLFPLFHATLFRFFSTRIRSGKIRTGALLPLSILLPFLFYLLIVSNKYYTLTGSRTRFGLEVTSYNNPVGAARFIEQKGLKNKKCFSDYLTSSYLLWKLQPGFKTFIDLRDLDVFPESHFQKFLLAAHYPDKFLSLDSLYHFDYVVLFRPEYQNLHAYLYNDSLYACTYVDAVAAVYEKTDDFTRDDIFSNCSRERPSSFSSALNKMLNPFYSSFNYRTIDYNAIAADYYTIVAQPALAEARRRSQGR